MIAARLSPFPTCCFFCIIILLFSHRTECESFATTALETDNQGLLVRNITRSHFTLPWQQLPSSVQTICASKEASQRDGKNLVNNGLRITPVLKTSTEFRSSLDVTKQLLDISEVRTSVHHHLISSGKLCSNPKSWIHPRILGNKEFSLCVFDDEDDVVSRVLSSDGIWDKYQSAVVVAAIHAVKLSDKMLLASFGQSALGAGPVVAMDIGAHVGYFSLLMGAHSGVNVIAIEPYLPSAARFLVSLKHVRNRDAQQRIGLYAGVALGDTWAVDSLVVEEGNKGWAHLKSCYNIFSAQQMPTGDVLRESALGATGLTSNHAHAIELWKACDLLQPWVVPNVVRINAAGMELRILRGAVNCICKGHLPVGQVLILQWAPTHHGSDGCDSEKFLKWIYSPPCSFQLSQIAYDDVLTYMTSGTWSSFSQLFETVEEAAAALHSPRQSSLAVFVKNLV